MSLDDLYNHLKVYKPKVQKKSDSQNMAFISLSKNSSRNEEVNTASVPTASTQVSPAGANVAPASISLNTACAYIASQSNGMRADRFWKKTWKKISIHGTNVAGFNKLKDWSYMANDEENHALVADEEAPTEFALMAKSSTDNEVFDNSLFSKACLSRVEARLVEFKNQEIKFCKKIRASKDLDNLLESQRSDKNKEGLGYSVVPPPTQVYSPSKKDMSWTGLPEFADDIITNYTRPSPSVESNPNDFKNSSSSAFENGESTSSILSKPEIKFMKPVDCSTVVKTDKKETGNSQINIDDKEKEKLKELRVKIIRCDNGGKFRNKEINDFCSRKGIKREFSNARTPQQNRVAERRNRTLIKAAKTMLADAKLPVTFWAEAVNTAWKFKAKGDEGYFIGYSMSSKAFRVFNKRTKRVEENLHVNFLENKPIEKGAGPNWLFNIDSSTNSINYVLVVVAGINSTNFSGTKEAAGQDVKKDVSSLRYIVLPNWFYEAHLESSTSNAQDACNADAPASSGNSNPNATSTNPPVDHMETLAVESLIPTVSSHVLTACLNDSLEPSSNTRFISKRVTSQDDTPSLDNILTLTNRFEDILGVTTNTDDTNRVEADIGNMEDNISASPTPTLRIHKDHPKSQMIGPMDTLNVWSLVDCPKRVRPIGTKWVLKNKKDERGIVIRNKARLVAQGHTQEEWIAYDEVFAPVARIEAIRLFLAYASFMGFTDPKFPARVYKVEKAMYGLHQAPRSWYGTLSKYLLTNGFQKGTIDQTLFIRRQRGDFILVQVYVDDNIFGSSNLQLCREFEALMHEKFQVSAMGELNFFLGLQVLRKKGGIFLSQDKPDIMFAVRAYARHQVTPKECHMHAVEHAMRGSVSRNYIIYNAIYDLNTDFHQIVDFVEASHLRRNLKLKDEVGISSLPDAELFENLTLMGYNILPNQKFTFQKRQFSHQWKYLIHTIMQCLSPKSTGFNEFSSNIATALVCLATNRVYNFSKMIFNGEGSGTPTEPHHTPSPKAQQTSPTIHSSPSLPPVTTKPLPTVIPFDTPQLRQYTRRARIAQSSALLPVADEPASPIGDDSQGEACPTDSGLETKQHRANITKTSTLPSDLTPRVTSLAADKGNVQHKLTKLTDLCTRVKLLEDKEGGGIAHSGEDAPIKGMSLDEGEEATIERSMEKGSNDTEEMINVLTSLDATTVLSCGVFVSISPITEVFVAEVPTGSGSIPTASPSGTGVPTGGVPTGSDVVPTASPIFTTATVATPYTRRKGKEKMVEFDTPKKKKLQEQIDIQVAREMEEHMVREDQRRNEQIKRDAKIARIHAEKELQIMIDGLDRNNETVANDMVKYQDIYTKVLKFQTQQRKPLSWKQQKEFYMSVLKSHSGWKAKHFKGMTLEEIKEKFDLVWKQIQDFIPIGSKEESERFKRKGLRLEQDSAKKLKTSEEVHEEKLKEMMQLIPVEEVYVEALQVKHPILDWEHLDREDLNQLWALVKETLNIRPASSDKEKELWVELKRLYESDVEDLLWTHTQNMMHASVEWKLYDTCGVDHVISKDQEMFMLVEKDYPLRKGLSIVMISYKLQAENYSHMANNLILKIHKITNSPRQQDD
nr:hypothetical protein [Tanacetum cinerariifolium]